jgi:hypothetical protein
VDGLLPEADVQQQMSSSLEQDEVYSQTQTELERTTSSIDIDDSSFEIQIPCISGKAFSKLD